MMTHYDFLLARPSQAPIFGRGGKVCGHFLYISPKILSWIVAPTLEFWKTQGARC